MPPTSVIKHRRNGTQGSLNSLVLSISGIADEFPPFGSNPALRDQKLRAFWPTEPILASAMYSTVSKYTAFGFTLHGPPRTVQATHDMLDRSEHGGGWQKLMVPTLVDLFSCDNAAFIEIVRFENSESSPAYQLNHLDSGRCQRTGDPETPVIYWDTFGNGHELKWYQVLDLAEFPSPIEALRGLQLCAVSRLLIAAQTLRDISRYNHEKVSGRNQRAIHLVSGVQTKSINDAIAQHQEFTDSQGFTRYIQPQIIAALDPTSRITHALIELASLPDGFNYDESMKWYINQLALAFGSDYQDYAPLPGGNLGTASQSQVLHLKARGKGPAMFMRLVEQQFNFHGVMPRTVKFSFGETDYAADSEQEQLRLLRAQTRAARIASGEITVQVAQQIALDDGDLDERYLELMGQTNATQEISLGASS
jgi:hypothetical protein